MHVDLSTMQTHLLGEEQEQRADGVADHDYQERDLSDQGSPTRKQRKGPVVGRMTPRMWPRTMAAVWMLRIKPG